MLPRFIHAHSSLPPFVNPKKKSQKSFFKNPPKKKDDNELKATKLIIIIIIKHPLQKTTRERQPI
jgi:hypothetical protein